MRRPQEVILRRTGAVPVIEYKIEDSARVVTHNALGTDVPAGILRLLDVVRRLNLASDNSVLAGTCTVYVPYRYPFHYELSHVY